MSVRIVPVILCGGSGTRLWPRSRKSKPKPFLPLLGSQTLFEATIDRCSDRSIFAAPVVVIGNAHLPLAMPQAAPIAPDARFIVEPMGKNTAPAIALAALSLAPDDVMLVCPSDHFIADVAAFRAAASDAASLAAQGFLVSFGIEATAPETGYGYIRRGEAMTPGYRIHSFVEKPDRDRAMQFLAAGDYVWNGGIFAFRVGDFLAELATHRPQMLALVEEAWRVARNEGNAAYPQTEAFARIDGDSVDYAVMENTDKAALVDVSMGWSDIGNWDALMEQRGAGADGNSINGPGEVIAATGTMIDTDGPHVTVVGVDNVIVVVDGEDVLVASRDSVQRVNEADRCRNQ